MTTGVENYYDILGLSEDADDDQVKQAFRELAKHHHPDHNPGDANADQEFKRINTAYEGLKDASRRQAYNEWLAFSDRREKTKRTQWGRLAAMVFLLLLGPTAALYWVVVVGDIAVFDSAGDRPGALVSASQDRKPDAPAPEPVEASAPTPPAVTPRQASLEPPAAPPASQPAVTPAPVPRASTFEKPAVAAAPPPAPAGPTLSERAAAAAAQQGGASPGGSDVTQSLPTYPRKPVGPSEADIARLEEAARRYESSAGRGATADDEDGGARAAARLLARAKEPDVAQPSAPAPAAPSPSAPVTKRPLPGDTNADAFTDCPLCPVMSPTRRPARAEDAPGLAVSLSAITVAQWSACVGDGACPPYRFAARSADDPVLNVSQREATAYANWLSGVTGQPYRVVTPFASQQAARDCESGGRRRNSNGFQWLEDGESEPDCAPGGGQGFESARGFRVARGVRPGG